MITVIIALQQANQQLSSSSETPTLDAEILLADILKISRSYLFAFPERELTSPEITSFENAIQQRKQQIPIAYIVGHKEFWSLDLKVTRDTLIPRPETELLVELALKQVIGPEKIIADLGTGSGAIALALAHERPSWEIHATDLSSNALDVAKQNAARLQLSNIHFHSGNWLEALPLEKKFDMIVSNPPYVAWEDPFLERERLQHEPQSAWMADENGLKEIRCIITHAKQYLKRGGRLLLEHGFEQAAEVRRFFTKWGYSDIETYRDLGGHERVTGGTV